MNSKVRLQGRQLGNKNSVSTEHSRKFSHVILAGLVTGLLFSMIAMSIIFLTFFAFPNFVPVFADESHAGDVSPRPIGEMRRDVEAFMKNSKSDDDIDVQVGGIVDLCYMHQEIVADPRFSSNRQLQSIRAVAADRLKKYLKTIRIEKARQSRRIKKEQTEESNKLLAGESVPKPATDEGGAVTGNLPGSAGQLSASASEGATEISDAEAIDESMYNSMSSLGNLTGGPSQMFSYLPGKNAPPWDHGEELVNLIESTINPDFWKINGGSGIIYYYRPSRIIVVGATSQIQDDLTDLLRGLRRLSR